MSFLSYVKSRVIKGFGRGSRELGCPTANIANIDNLEIPTGIYCGLGQVIIRRPEEIQEQPGQHEAYVKVVGQLPYDSGVIGWVGSHGFNPHYGNKERSLEVHLLNNFKFDFYGAEIRVLICKKMRDEEKYDSLDELKKAIANDIQIAKSQVVKFSHLSEDVRYFQQDLTKAESS